MAKHKSPQYPFRWPDGSYHSREYAGGHGTHNPAQKKPAPKPGPAMPPAPVGQHFVPDSGYNAAVSLADRHRSQQLGSLDAQEQGIKFDYGIDDPTNPNSRAAALKQSYLNRANATINGAGNQLYSGSTQRNIETNRRNQERDLAAERRSYESALAGIRDARAGVEFDTEQAKAQAYQDAIDRAPAAVGRNPQPSAPPAPAALPGSKSPATPQQATANNPFHFARSPWFHPKPTGKRGSFGPGRLGPGAKSVIAKPKPKAKKKKH